MTNTYEARLIRVLDYIHDNPAGDLSLDALADVAALSRFHFHRVFHALMGETAAQAVRRMRMYRASVALVQTTAPLAKIARALAIRTLLRSPAALPNFMVCPRPPFAPRASCAPCPPCLELENR